VRQLEDFIITECFYTNIIGGKLDQKKACLQVIMHKPMLAQCSAATVYAILTQVIVRSSVPAGTVSEEPGHQLRALKDIVKPYLGCRPSIGICLDSLLYKMRTHEHADLQMMLNLGEEGGQTLGERGGRRVQAQHTQAKHVLLAESFTMQKSIIPKGLQWMYVADF